MSTDTARPVTAESFVKLPRGAQLMAAYALINDKWQIQMMKNDIEMIALVSAGWLVAKPSAMHGIVNCEFPDDVWTGMEAIEPTILNSVTEDEMERYTKRKGKEYPWLW